MILLTPAIANHFPQQVVFSSFRPCVAPRLLAQENKKVHSQAIFEKRHSKVGMERKVGKKTCVDCELFTLHCILIYVYICIPRCSSSLVLPVQILDLNSLGSEVEQRNSTSELRLKTRIAILPCKVRDGKEIVLDTSIWTLQIKWDPMWGETDCICDGLHREKVCWCNQDNGKHVNSLKNKSCGGVCLTFTRHSILSHSVDQTCGLWMGLRPRRETGDGVLVLNTPSTDSCLPSFRPCLAPRLLFSRKQTARTFPSVIRNMLIPPYKWKRRCARRQPSNALTFDFTIVL